VLVAHRGIHALLEALDLALGLRVVRLTVLLRDAALVFEWLRPPLPPAKRVVNTSALSVSVEAGKPYLAAVARKVPSTIGPVTRTCAASDRRSGSSRRVS